MRRPSRKAASSPTSHSAFDSGSSAPPGAAFAGRAPPKIPDCLQERAQRGARVPPGGAQPQRAQGLGPERLVARHPRQPHARVDVCGGLTASRMPVDAQPRGEEVAVPEREHVLCEETGRRRAACQVERFAVAGFARHRRHLVEQAHPGPCRPPEVVGHQLAAERQGRSRLPARERGDAQVVQGPQATVPVPCRRRALRTKGPRQVHGSQVLAREVVSQRQAMGREGAPAERRAEAPREAVDPLVVVVAEQPRDVPRVGRAQEVAVLAHGAQEDALHTPARRRVRCPEAGVGRPDAGFQARRERQAQIAPERVALEPVERKGVRVVLVFRRREVVHGPGAPVDGEPVLLVPLASRPAATPVGRPVDAFPARVVRDAVPGRGASLVASAPPGVAQEVLDVQVVHPVDPEPRDPTRALRHLGGPARRARHAALCEDLDDAVGRSGPEEGGRGRPLDHLDALDVPHADEIQRAGRDVGAPGESADGAVEELRREGALHHAHPVDVDQRVAGQDHAAVAPQPDLLALARLRAAPRDFHADGGALQKVRQGRRAVRHLVDLEPGHGVPDLTPPPDPRLARHDDLVHRERLRRQRDVDDRGAFRRHAHRPAQRAVPDELDPEDMVTGRHRNEHEPSVVPGKAGVGRAFQDQFGAG